MGELSNFFIFALQVGLEHSHEDLSHIAEYFGQVHMRLCQIRLTSPCYLLNNYSSVCLNYSRLSCSYYMDGYFHGKSYGIMACLLSCSKTMRH